MKKHLLLRLLTIFVALTVPYVTQAQCQFVSPSVELLSTQLDSNGNCVVNFNLGFEIDINNGNKIIFIHLWRTQDYTIHNYSNQNQPKESNVLANALATIVIDNDVVNNNSSAPPSQVFMTSYGPDPGIDDNTGPAMFQVKDASDGLTYNRVVVNASTNIYRYTINNLILVVPGACTNQIDFTGDAWSSNANSASPSVQCSMTGFSFLVNDPTISTSFTCQPEGTSNNYSYVISTTSPQSLTFNTDVYVDNGDDFFDVSLDIPVVSNAGPYTITSGSPFNSGVLTYTAPYSTTEPYRKEDLWIVVKNMSLTNNTVIPPTVTTISNLLLGRVINTCSFVILPVSILDFNGYRKNELVQLKWKVAETADLDRFVVQRKMGNDDWKDIATVYNERDNKQEKTFGFTDENPTSAMSLYRINAISKNGEDGYTRQIMINGMEQTFSYMISPNPSVNGTLSVKLHALSGSTTIRAFNIQGQLIRTLQADKSGTYSFSGLSAGTYYVSLKSSNGSVSHVSKAIVLSK
ncbi:MAG: T9SS type A sorting domain-containing protein [Taibaiella sp.]|jgi:hypothetical protein